MNMLPRWLSGLIGPAVLAAGLGAGALLPVTAHAQDSLTRVLVDVADVVIRGGHFRAAALDNVRNSKRLHTACTPPGTRCGIDRCDATFAAASRWRV